VEAAPEALQPSLRRSLADTLRGVVAQRLVPRRDAGRTAVCEVLVPDEALRVALASGHPLGSVPGGPDSVAFADEVEALRRRGEITDEWAEKARGWLG